MANYDKNHYVQKALLNNFATQVSKNDYRICVLDLIHFGAKLQSTSSFFQEDKLYDTPQSDNPKELELAFSEKIETPMSQILAKCVSNNKYTFTRSELEIIKKYILLQLYRTPNNKKSYASEAKNNSELIQYNINEGESRVDFWKREMKYILDNPWDSLLTSDMVGIKSLSIELNTSFLMFLHTNNEFCVNDLGYATERVPIVIQDNEREEFIKSAREFGKTIFGLDNWDELAKQEIENGNSYIENFILFPISSNIAILLVSSIWKSAFIDQNIRMRFKNKLYSPILSKHFSLPITSFVNRDKIKTQADILRYKDSNDTYKYTVHKLSENETIHLNHLLMNEALRYVGVKTPSALIPSIKEYTKLGQKGIPNLHHSFNGFVELLIKLSK